MPPSYLSVVSGRQPVPKFTKDGFLVKSAAHVSTRRAGGVHVAVQNFAQRGDAVRAGEANPHRRINLIRKGGIGAVFEERRFKAGGRVEHNDNALERAVGDSGQQINFVLVKLQIVASGDTAPSLSP